MSDHKFTAAQLATLQCIAAGTVHQALFGYGAWRIQGAPPTVVGRLVSLGFARWGPSWTSPQGQRMDCIATERGLAALTNAGGGQ